MTARRQLACHVLRYLPTVVAVLPYERLRYAVLPQTLCVRVRNSIS